MLPIISFPPCACLSPGPAASRRNGKRDHCWLIAVMGISCSATITSKNI